MTRLLRDDKTPHAKHSFTKGRMERADRVIRLNRQQTKMSKTALPLLTRTYRSGLALIAQFSRASKYEAAACPLPCGAV